MKEIKIFFIVTLVGILTLMFLTQVPHEQTGTIKSIRYSENKITIHLENNNATLIIFNSQSLNLKSGDKISFEGKFETYRGEKQIIVNKIIKSN